MIPKHSGALSGEIAFAQLSSRTFKIHDDSMIIAGQIDELDAMRQVVNIILNVERYQYLIHSWQFGVEFLDLFGQPVSFCLPEIKRRITEALMQDARITGVDNFEFQVVKGRVHAAFEVATIYGTFTAEKEVDT